MFVRAIALELGLGLFGFALLAINSWQSPEARRRGARTHWARGWILNGAGMILIGTSWVLLALGLPRLDGPILTWLAWLGLPLGAAGALLYLVGARHAGRLKSLSEYSLELDKTGPYSLVRHPQALALSLGLVSLALMSRSIPLLATLPVWLLCLYGYTYLEEEFELVPTFGDQYVQYREETPRLFPRLGELVDSLTSATLVDASRERH